MNPDLEPPYCKEVDIIIKPECEENEYYSPQEASCLPCADNCEKCKYKATYCTECQDADLTPPSCIPRDHEIPECDEGFFNDKGECKRKNTKNI